MSLSPPISPHPEPRTFTLPPSQLKWSVHVDVADRKHIKQKIACASRRHRPCAKQAVDTGLTSCRRPQCFPPSYHHSIIPLLDFSSCPSTMMNKLVFDDTDEAPRPCPACLTPTAPVRPADAWQLSASHTFEIFSSQKKFPSVP